jgi:hypothetical protein
LRILGEAPGRSAEYQSGDLTRYFFVDSFRGSVYPDLRILPFSQILGYCSGGRYRLVAVLTTHRPGGFGV